MAYHPVFNPTNPSMATECIDINVGGKMYTTTVETIRKYPHSRLAKMLLHKSILTLRDNQGRYFIDRNGELFGYVLDYMRLGKLNVPTTSPQCVMLYEEAVFFELPEMAQECERNQGHYYSRYPECPSFPKPPLPNKLNLWVKVTKEATQQHLYAGIPQELHLSGSVHAFSRLRWLDEYRASHIYTHSGEYSNSVSAVFDISTNEFLPIYCKISENACEVLHRISWEGFTLKGSHNGYLIYEATYDRLKANANKH